MSPTAPSIGSTSTDALPPAAGHCPIAVAMAWAAAEFIVESTSDPATKPTGDVVELPPARYVTRSMWLRVLFCTAVGATPTAVLMASATPGPAPAGQVANTWQFGWFPIER
jgi:hypothetical protein